MWFLIGKKESWVTSSLLPVPPCVHIWRAPQRASEALTTSICFCLWLFPTSPTAHTCAPKEFHSLGPYLSYRSQGSCLKPDGWKRDLNPDGITVVALHPWSKSTPFWMNSCETQHRGPPSCHPNQPLVPCHYPLSWDSVSLSPSLLSLLAQQVLRSMVSFSPLNPLVLQRSSPRNVSPLSIMRFSMNRCKSPALNSKLELWKLRLFILKARHLWEKMLGGKRLVGVDFKLQYQERGWETQGVTLSKRMGKGVCWFKSQFATTQSGDYGLGKGAWKEEEGFHIGPGTWTTILAQVVSLCELEKSACPLGHRTFNFQKAVIIHIQINVVSDVKRAPLDVVQCVTISQRPGGTHCPWLLPW